MVRMKSRQLATKKSEILKQLSNNYPNFLKKDLAKVIEIFIIEMKSSLKRKERVELRDVFSIEPRLKKARYARNPKTNERVFIEEKYTVFFKISKYWSKKVNE